MARNQISGSAALTAVTTFQNIYTVPSAQNFEIDYLSLQNVSAAIAAGNVVTLTEMSGATVIDTIAVLTPNVQGIWTPTKYIAAGGNILRISQTGTATITIRWALFGNLV